jgi:hypothetical protein
MRIGGVLFVGEDNLGFALTMSREPRVPTSSILVTVYEEEQDLTDTAYDKARKFLNLGCSVKTGVEAKLLSDTIRKRQFRTVIFQFPNLCCNQVEMSPGLQSRNVTKSAGGSKA